MKSTRDCVCKVCQKSYVCQDDRDPNGLLYCSTACYFEDHPDKKAAGLKDGTLKECDVCGKVCLGRGRRCSAECKLEASRRAVKACREKSRLSAPAKKCAICGNESRTKYCSDACRAICHSRYVKEYKARVRAGKSESAGPGAIGRMRMLLGELRRLLERIEGRTERAIAAVEATTAGPTPAGLDPVESFCEPPPDSISRAP